MSTHSANFNAYSRYYDLLYKDKDYVGEAAYIKSLLVKQGLTQGSLLEFGSGTGKHGNLLASNGYQVHGIERSAEMVSLAKQGGGFTCERGDICTVKLNRKFDAVLSLFHVISYQITNQALTDVFSRASEHLQSGGLFVFDFWYSPAVYAQKPVVRVKRMADSDVEITRIAEPVIIPNENRVDVNFTVYAHNLSTGDVQTLKETHPMRHLSLPEIDLLAKATGFSRIDAEEFQTAKTPSEYTWGVCVTLRKI